MEWTNLLSKERLGDPDYTEEPNRPIFVQDYDRIVFSPPFRRLANKTQVQPLYEHDHVHHRLIHSVEVGSVGRSLAMGIGQWLVDQQGNRFWPKSLICCLELGVGTCRPTPPA